MTSAHVLDGGKRGACSAAELPVSRAWRGRLFAIALFLSVVHPNLPARAQTFEVAHVFAYGGQPRAHLILARDGLLYGTTSLGGDSDQGSVFRIDTAGNLAVLHDFHDFDGSGPDGELLEAADGYFYGTTYDGGAYYDGTVFRMDLAGNLTTLHEFHFGDVDGAFPSGSLMQALDGFIYGTTRGNAGTIFRIGADGSFQTMHVFQYADGAGPAGLLQTDDGTFIGATSSGGTFDGGTVFRMDASGQVTTLHSFSGDDEGADPSAAFIRGTDGFYYTTAAGGGAGAGAIFRMDAGGAITTLHILGGLDGVNPEGPLVQAADGFFYGTTQSTIFRMDAAGNFAILHTLTTEEGSQAGAGISLGPDGALYGTCWLGGGGGAGSIFRIDTAGSFKVLYSFVSADGNRPIAGLVQGPDGFLYGATALGGANGLGAIFRMNNRGRSIVLHAFAAADVGANPQASLLWASDGNLYGTTGAYGARGTVFRITPTGDLTTLHIYGIGNSPSSLISGPGGYLFGTTPSGGYGYGSVIRVDPAGGVADFHLFSSIGAYVPMAPLLLAADGNYYGTTWAGGPSNEGTVFRMSPSGTVNVIHSFSGVDGSYPQAGLIQATDGNLYGATNLGGISDAGAIFRISLTGSFIKLYDFSSTDGAHPAAALFQANDGNLYGTTYDGGAFGVGTVFRMPLSGTLTTIHEFSVADGSHPQAALIEASDGYLYGTAGFGYTAPEVVFRIILQDFAVTTVTPASGPASGGTTIRVGGAGFSAMASLSIGGAAVVAVVENPSEIDTTSPALTPGSLNDVRVDNPSSSSRTLTTAFFADFLDVPVADLFHGSVETLARYGLTAGCGGGNFCPGATVTRAQWAVFLLKAEHGPTWVPPSCTGIFDDVPCPGPFTDWIEALQSEGVTGGCGGADYCPADPVTRAQAAPLLLKTEHGPGYVPPPCAGAFGDVACPSLFADWIEQLSTESVTAGCVSNPALYCPSADVLRGSAAALLVRAFKLP